MHIHHKQWSSAFLHGVGKACSDILEERAASIFKENKFGSGEGEKDVSIIHHGCTDGGKSDVR
jgi:hypothetical protein